MVWIFTASCSCVGKTPGEGAKPFPVEAAVVQVM